MIKNTLTFGLEGEVALEEFARALNDFNNLLNNLSGDVASGVKIEWIIDELYAGSAVATFRGEYGDLQIVEKIIDAYEDIGESLTSGHEISYSNPVKRSIQKITDILNGKISAVRFETPVKDYMISSKVLSGEKITPIKFTTGTIKGTVQTLSMRKKLSFTIWDSMFDRAVNCYLKEGSEETMRNIWGKRAIVAGKIGRQSETGKPVVIREVRYVKKLEDTTPGNYKHARGVIPWVEGNELPEEIIRRIRNE